LQTSIILQKPDLPSTRILNSTVRARALLHRHFF